jgi:hypothetical protein
MKKTLIASVVVGLLSLASVQAGGFSWGVSIGFGHPVVYTPPVYVAPPPVVYVNPQPVVYAQPTVVYVPQPVVYAPVVTYYPQPVVWVGGHRHHHGRR